MAAERAAKRAASPWCALLEPGERRARPKVGEESPDEEYDGDPGIRPPEAELESPDEESEKDPRDEEYKRSAEEVQPTSRSEAELESQDEEYKEDTGVRKAITWSEDGESEEDQVAPTTSTVGLNINC